MKKIKYLQLASYAFIGLGSLNAMAQYNAVTNPLTGTITQEVSNAAATAANITPNVAPNVAPAVTPAHIPTEAELKLKMDRESVKPSATWVVKKDSWSETDELEYSQFIHKLGKAVEQKKCGSVNGCLKDETINPYYEESVDGTDANGNKGFHYSDCADLPYYLRAYFAYKKNLPFAYVNSIEANPPLNEEEQAEWDKKLAENENPSAGTKALFGNQMKSRSQVPAGDGKSRRDFYSYTYRMADSISSGIFRNFRRPEGALLPDTYIPRLDIGALKYGAVTYNPAGHVGVIYDITPKGDIKILDAHPDNTLTVKKFWEIFRPSRPAHGSSIQVFRPFKLVGYKTFRDGSLMGGKIEFVTDDQLPASDELVLGSNPDVTLAGGKRVYINNGIKLNFLDFVRSKIATGDPKTYPVEDFKDRLLELCNKFKSRVEMIEGSKAMSPNERAEYFKVSLDLSNQNHSGMLPPNIYNASGDWQFWEDRSTPGRDGDTRLAILDTAALAQDLLDRAVKPDAYFSYKGNALKLKSELIRAYHQQVAQCRIAYTTSKMTKVKISLSEAIRRIMDMSFDVYHCLERKYGARDPKELQMCAETPIEKQMYEYEAYLRQRTERNAEVMGFNVVQLRDENTKKFDRNRSFNLEKMLTNLKIKNPEK